MNGTAKKSRITDTLSYRRISPDLYEVESRSLTLGSHLVRRDERGEWRCDAECIGYATLVRCSHVASVLRAEREALEREVAAASEATPGQDVDTLTAADGPAERCGSCACFVGSSPYPGCPCWCHVSPTYHATFADGAPLLPLEMVPVEAAPEVKPPPQSPLRQLGSWLKQATTCPTCSKSKMRLATGHKGHGTGRHGEAYYSATGYEQFNPDKHCACTSEPVQPTVKHVGSRLESLFSEGGD